VSAPKSKPALRAQPDNAPVTSINDWRVVVIIFISGTGEGDPPVLARVACVRISDFEMREAWFKFYQSMY